MNKPTRKQKEPPAYPPENRSKKPFRAFVSILLVVLLTMTFLPISAFAYDADVEIQEDTIVEVVEEEVSDVEDDGDDTATEPTTPSDDDGDEGDGTTLPTTPSDDNDEDGDTTPSTPLTDDDDDDSTPPTDLLPPDSEVSVSSDFNILADSLDGESHLVTFMSNGNVWLEVEVPDVATVSNPGTPPAEAQPERATGFNGWSTSADEFIVFDFDTEITDDLTLFADYETGWLVKYKTAPGGDELVYETKVVANGDLVPSPSTMPTFPAGSVFKYWYVEGDSSETEINFGTATVTADVTLVPKLVDEYIVFFDSAGGSVVDPQAVVGGETAAEPLSPTRTGYTFVAWVDADGNPFNFATPITSNITLKAKWTPQVVAYTVMVWMEKPNFDGTPTPGNSTHYNYVLSVPMTGTAGTMTTIDASTLAGYFNGTIDTTLKYAQFQSADNKEIRGNGTTVVNVFASRKIYTYNFNFNGSSRTVTITNADGTTTQYTGSYSFSAKYEQDLTYLWPCGDGVSFSFNYESWGNPTPSVVETARFTSKRNVLDYSIISRNGQATSYSFTVSTSNNSEVQYRYFYSLLPGETAEITYNNTGFIEDEGLRQNIRSTLTAKVINGFTSINNDYVTRYVDAAGNYYTSSGSGRTAVRCFFYTRNTYTLSFDSNRPDGVAAQATGMPASRSLKYEQPVGAAPTTDPELEGYAFAGWFKDPDCIEPFDFGSTMPNSNVVVFAKWTPTEFWVTFYDDDIGVGVELDSVGKARGDYVLDSDCPLQPGTVVIGKGTFSGWKFYVNGRAFAFDFGMAVTSDLDLYAVYDVEGFTITYNVGLGRTGSVAPVDGDTYDAGTMARVLSGKDLIPPEGTIFIGWHTEHDPDGYIRHEGSFYQVYGDTEFVAVYGVASDYVRLTYHSNYSDGSAENTTTWLVNKNTAVTLHDETLFTFTNWEIIGWDENPAATTPAYAPGALYNMLEADVDLYAIWAQVAFNVTYNPGTQGLWSEVSHDGLASGSTTPTPPTGYDTNCNPGYEFIGWNPTWSDTVTGDVVYVAQWSAIDYDVIYDANGGTINGTATYADPSNPYNVDDTVYVISDEPVRDGYSFLGWAYAGDTYFDGDDFIMPASDVTLVAKWSPNENTAYTVTWYDAVDGSVLKGPETRYGTTDTTASVLASDKVGIPGYTYTGDDYQNNVLSGNINGDGSLKLKLFFNAIDYEVVYNGNGGTVSGVTIYSDPSNPYHVDDEVVIISTEPIRAGYTFTGWLYGGTTYQAGDDFIMPASDVQLVAQWTANADELVYDKNAADATGATGPTAGVTDETVTVLDNGFSRAGYRFAGWNTAADGSGTPYAPGDGYTLTPESDVLYAIWIANDDTIYKVEHHKVNADGTDATHHSTTTHGGETDTTATATPITIDGHTYSAGFDQNGMTEILSGNIHGDSSLVLRLYYEPDPDELVYDANALDATGTTGPTAGVVEGTVIVETNGFVREGHTFVEWNTAADGSGTVYDPGDDYMLTLNDDILYAQWIKNPVKEASVGESVQYVGDKMSYSVSQANIGNIVEFMTITDNLPAGLSFESFSVDGGPIIETLPAGNIFFQGDIDPGQTVVVVINGVVNENALIENDGVLTNTASVTVNDKEYFSNPTENPIQPKPEPEKVSSKGDGIVRPGDELDFTLTHTNEGTITQVGATLTDPLPFGVDFVSYTVNGGAEITTLPAGNAFFFGDIEPGDTVTIFIRTLVNEDALSIEDGVIINTGILTIDNKEYFSNPTENPVQPPPELLKEIDEGVTYVDDIKTYTITVTNIGTLTAEDVSIDDDLPTGLDFISYNVDGGAEITTQPTDNVYFFGDIPAGSSVVVTITGRVNETAVENGLFNQAEVKIGDRSFFTNPVETEVDPTPKGFKTSSAGDGGAVSVGDTITYTIDYPNHASGVRQVTIRDTVPANTTIKTVFDFGVLSGNTITWTKDLQPGEVMTVHFSVIVNSDAYDATVTNTAQIIIGDKIVETNTVTNTVNPKPPVDPDPDPDPDPIPDPKIPGAETFMNGGASWALLNLILALFGFVCVLPVFLAWRRKNKKKEVDEGFESEEYENRRSSPAWWIVGLLVAIAAGILFLLTEDIRLPMVFTDKWTLMHVLLAAVQAIFSLFAIRKIDNDDEQPDVV